MADENKVSYEQQKQMGLIRTSRNPYVAPGSNPEIVRLPDANDSIMLNVTPSAQQLVRMETSYIDKAKGFHIAFTPIAFLAGAVVLAIAVFYRNVEMWSLLALIIFAIATLVVWLCAWLFTLLIGPEMVSFYEAWRKWNVVDREQRERHSYYRKQGKRR